MYRIPIPCADPGEKRAHAPMLSGEIELHGHASGSLVFMVDTGADQTAVTQGELRLPKRVWEAGTRETTTGVGGQWPARKFTDDAALYVIGEDERGEDVVLKLPLPKLSVLAPYAERRAGGSPKEHFRVAPNSRRVQAGRIEPCPTFRALLGRDVIYTAHARLEYDPREQSCLMLESVRGEVEVLSATGQEETE